MIINQQVKVNLKLYHCLILYFSSIVKHVKF